MPGESDHFREEADMLIKLEHPQLPHIVDYYPPDADGYAYLVMDYIEGLTLQNWFDQKGKKLSYPLVVQIAWQLCDIFQYLHTRTPRPVIYRDLKPSNVMLDSRNHVRLIDFGIARHFHAEKDGDTLQIGTIGFAAPEQFALSQTDARSDLYTLGAMIYYLLSDGQYYYLAKVPLSNHRPDLPQGFSEVVQKLLHEDPRERYQTANEVKLRLQEFVSPDVSSLNKGATHGQQASPAVSIPPRLIVVGGLYPGVGATFAAMSMARALNAIGIPNSMVEHPNSQPDLYMLLDGDRRTPKGYTFVSDDILLNNGIPAGGAGWVDGHTTWVPVNPDGLTGAWTAPDSYKLIHAVKKPIVIWDISAGWSDPTVMELCRHADEIIGVVDPSPAKLSRPGSRLALELLHQISNEGKSVHWLVNRNVSQGIGKKWTDGLPAPPICRLPAFEYEPMVKSVWKGECFQDQADVAEAILDSLHPLLKLIVPEKALLRRPVRPRSLLSRLMGRG